MLWGLHHADGFVFHQARRAREEIRHGNEVGIQDGNELRLIAQTCHVVQRVIDVAGFGVRIVRAGQVATAEFFSQALEPQASSVIQDPNAIVAVFQPRGADDRTLQNRLLLIVGADEDIDERRRCRRCGSP